MRLAILILFGVILGRQEAWLKKRFENVSHTYIYIYIVLPIRSRLLTKSIGDTNEKVHNTIAIC